LGKNSILFKRKRFFLKVLSQENYYATNKVVKTMRIEFRKLDLLAVKYLNCLPSETHLFQFLSKLNFLETFSRLELVEVLAGFELKSFLRG
jgi:hypothetical protein